MTYHGDTWHHRQPPPPGETLLSSVSGLTLAAASSLAHDLFGHAMRDGRAGPRTEPAVAPVLTYALFWRGFGHTGLPAALYGGTACVLLLTMLSTAVSGGPTALFPGRDFHWFKLQTAGLVSIPFGFLAGRLGSRWDRRRRDGTAAESRRLHEAGEARLLAGAG